MEMLNKLDTTIIDALVALYRAVHIDTDTLQLASIDRLLTGSDGAVSVTRVLSQISLLVSIIFAVIVAITVAKKRALKRGGAVEQDVNGVGPVGQIPPAGRALRNRWNDIVSHLESTHENDWKLAVVEADKLVDAALAQSGFPGDTFGDRLTNIKPGMLVSLDGLWWAHKIRNRIAHEMDYFLRYTEAKAAVSYYEAALAELQLI